MRVNLLGVDDTEPVDEALPLILWDVGPDSVPVGETPAPDNRIEFGSFLSVVAGEGKP